jgi:hypothetical protein
MKSYLLDFFPAIKRIDRKLDNLSQLLNYHWILFEDVNQAVETKFIFKDNNKLYVSVSGIVQDNCSWSYIDEHYINVSYNNISYLFQFGLIDKEQKVLVFRLSGTDSYIVFQNEKHKKLNVTIQQLLNEEYLDIEEKVSYKIPLIKIDYSNFNPNDFPKIIKELDKIIQFINQEKSHEENFDISIAKGIIWTYIKEHKISTANIKYYKNLITGLSNNSISTKNIDAILNNNKVSIDFVEQFENYFNSRFF